MIDLNALDDDEPIVIEKKPKRKAKPEKETEEPVDWAKQHYQRIKESYDKRCPLVRRQKEMKLLAQHSTKSQEHYTPSNIVEAARALMGGIDLDPCSSTIAQRTIRANQWYGWDSDAMQLNDGIAPTWRGKVFCNPPGGNTRDHAPHLSSVSRSYAAVWWRKAVSEWMAKNVEQVFFVGFTLEILRYSQKWLDIGVPCAADFPMCLPPRRIAFNYPDKTIDGRPESDADLMVGKSPAHASVLIWLPPLGEENPRDKMRHYFGGIGRCL